MSLDVFQELKVKAAENLLIDRFEISEVINKFLKFNNEFVILAKSFRQNKAEKIMPTVSAVKLIGKNLMFSDSGEHLLKLIKKTLGYKQLKNKTANSLQDILSNGFQYKKSLIEAKIEIFYDDIAIEHEFDLLIMGFDLLRKNSPNMLNASMDLALKESEKIEAYYKDSIYETATSISKFITENYGLKCKLINIINEKGKGSLNKKDLFILSKYGRPLYSLRKSGFVLLFPFTNDRRSVKIQHIFMIESKNSLSKYFIMNLTKSFNYYFDSCIPRLIINHISDLQNRIIAIHNDIEAYVEEINLVEKLHNFSEIAFEKIIGNTGAHSAVLHLYDPFENNLLQVTEVPDSKANIDAENKDISLKNSKNINVRTFQICNSETFAYFKNIEEQKKQVNSQDAQSSKSELCFPLYFKQIIIGTISFESLTEDGFGLMLKRTKKFKNKIEEYKNDTTFNFFYSIKKLIEEFTEVLFDSNDKLWLSKRIQIYQNIHELKALTRDVTLKSSYRETIANAIHLTHSISQNNARINLYESIRQFHKKFLSEIEDQSSEVAKIFEDRIIIHNSSGLDFFISDEKHSFLEVLFKNIFSNFFKSPPDRFNKSEVIIISILKNALFINVQFSFYGYSPENHYKYLVRPFSNLGDESNKIHYGLFLIGAITRHLKGICYIKKPDLGKKKSSILINIPLINQNEQ